MLTYPLSRVAVPARQGAVQRRRRDRPGAGHGALAGGAARRAVRLERRCRCCSRRRWSARPGWFFFYAIFALRIRRNDAFNTVTSVFYFVFLFASSMFYPLEPLPRGVSAGGARQPDHVARRRAALRDDRRAETRGRSRSKSAAFVVFTLVAFAAAVQALEREG